MTAGEPRASAGGEPPRLEVLPVGPLGANAYLLTDPAGGEAILVDPGEEPERLLEAVERSGCRLVQLLCTHGHFDHVGGAAALQRIHPLPLRCHPAAVELIEHLPDFQRAYGFPPGPVPRLQADLNEGTRIVWSGGVLHVRHVPGHAPGHILLTWPGNALVGDCVFAGSIGRTDLPLASFEQLAASIRDKIYSLPPRTRLHPGHGPPTTVDHESRTNPFVQGEQTS
jgi:hydroxyacylglutathione hydrolase